MTPEEIKAEQLINSFYKYAFEDIDGVGKWMNAKQCAIICVDEILTQLKKDYEDLKKNKMTTTLIYIQATENFYQSIKQAIQNA